MIDWVFWSRPVSSQREEFSINSFAICMSRRRWNVVLNRLGFRQGTRSTTGELVSGVEVTKHQIKLTRVKTAVSFLVYRRRSGLTSSTRAQWSCIQTTVLNYLDLFFSKLTMVTESNRLLNSNGLHAHGISDPFIHQLEV